MMLLLRRLLSAWRYARLHKVLAHPLRLEILALVSGTPRSALELEEELARKFETISLGAVRYHIAQMRKAGALELVRASGSDRSRHRYRPTEEALDIAGAVRELTELRRDFREGGER